MSGTYVRFMIVCWLLLVSSLAGAATVTWNNPSGGSWETGANWIPAKAPVPGDDVIIAGADSGMVTVNADTEISTLTLSGSPLLTLVSGTLTLSQALPQYSLSIVKNGTGSGTVTSTPVGIDCGSTCSAQSGQGTGITLTAGAAAGSTFSGWSGGGCSGSESCQVVMNGDTTITATFTGIAPASSFTASPAAPTVRQTVQFSDTSTGGPTTWAWNFGDNSTSTLQNPTHSYSTAGSYTVTLTVGNGYGTNVATQSLTVNPYPYLLVDTGQTKSYNATTEITAPTSGQPFYGQDAQYSGLQPAYRNNGDGTISDLNTGLMWVSARGSKVTWDSAVAGAALNRTGGYSDWRMPTIKELYSLIDFNGKSAATDAQSIPYINTSYFEIVFGDVTGGRVIDGQDWSATRYVSTTMGDNATIFGVNFIDGRIKGYPQYTPPSNTTGYTLYVRYVRGNSAYGVNDFVNNGDGTITDQATGLVWSQADSGTAMNWQDALAWVQAQNAAHYLGFSDWRLPNAKELQSIVDYTRSPATTGSATIDPLFSCTAITNEGGVADFPFYWAGTTHLDNYGGVYLAFGRALGWMKLGTATTYTLLDVHGAGAQRSDPKSGSVSSYYLGQNSSGNAVYGKGPQGDVIRITNYVRLVRDNN